MLQLWLRSNSFRILFSLLQLLLLPTAFIEGEVKKDVATGRILLGALIPMRSKSVTTELECGDTLRLSGFMLAHAMLIAIDQVNAREDILQNITLETRIYDTCRSQTISSAHIKEFIKMTLELNDDLQLAGIVGASKSDVSAKIASILQVFQIPQISFKSTSVLLSDRDLYQYFMRTVPPDSFQATAMVDICLRFNWSYVFTVNSEGIYGEKGIEEFHRSAEENNIQTEHVGKIMRIAEEKEYIEVIEDMISRSQGTSIRVVVLFCGYQHSIGILQAAQANPNAGRFIWLASDSIDTTLVDFTNITIITVQIMEESLSAKFRNYFRQLNMQDVRWKQHGELVRFWQDWFKCRLENTTKENLHYPPCKGDENLSEVTQAFTLKPIMTAVYAYAHGLHNLQQELCGAQRGMCSSIRSFKRERLLQHLRNVSFDSFLNTSLKFNENGEVAAIYQILNFQHLGASKFFAHVGEWDAEKTGASLSMHVDKIMWFNSANGSIPKSYCSPECPFGFVKEAKIGYPFPYCWECTKCDEDQLIVNNTCLTGKPGYVPNLARDAWIKRELIYLKWSDDISIIIMAVSVMAAIATLVVLCIFVTFAENDAVRASGRELSCIILTGILLTFATPSLFVAKPTDLTCVMRDLAPGLALSIIYSALFMKINRVYRVFASARTTTQRPAFIRPKSQVLITFALISMQVLITLLGELAELSRAREKYYESVEKLILECHSRDTIYFGTLSYVMVLMVLSTVYAFKTRKFPRNFNESRYIGFTLYATIALSVVFLAFYLNARDSVNQAKITAVSTLSTGLITLSGLFGQRLFVIFCVNKQGDSTFITKRSSNEKMGRHPEVESQDQSTKIRQGKVAVNEEEA